MALWGEINQANNAPKFVTNSGNGNTGIQDYGSEIIFVTGTEGYPVPPGWNRRYTRGNRVLWETLVAFSMIGGLPEDFIINYDDDNKPFVDDDGITLLMEN